jgi:hypothetical protein
MTGFPLTMTGWDRTYQPPRSLRSAVAMNTTAWDLFRYQEPGVAREWATTTLDSLLASVDSQAAEALGCTDCQDTGYYGVPCPDDEDMLVGLVRRIGNEKHETLAADGSWAPWLGESPLEILTLDLAGDLAAAITGGACGLVRRYLMPRAFLPPAPVLSAAPLSDALMSLVSPQPPGSTESSDNDWVTYAIVDELDPGAVLDLVHLRAAGGSVELERYDEDCSWTPDSSLLTENGLPTVRLTDSQLADVQEQMNPSRITAAAEDHLPPHPKCKYCSAPATKRILHSEGMAYIPVCDDHLDKGKADAAACVPYGDPDPSNINWIHDIKASAALVADAPLTVSPNPKAEKLRRYWSTGRGAAKIRWNTPGDWKRCYAHLSKYMGTRAKGYCQNLHKRNDHVWTGDRRNPGGNGHHGRGLFSSTSPEESLLASVRSGQWGRDKERNTDMPLAMELLEDGIYYEGDDDNAGILRTLTAGGFPVAPPDEWYADPKLPGPTPMVVDDDGRVYGHLATWDVTHIGMAGATHAPRSPSNYAYFLTGSLKTASGKSVNVGQLTLAGGHADINGNAQAAVQHYDDTNSAVADVMVGEDQFGIWAAGGMRPNVTPEQVRVFRASPPSGDWRPINGHLEMVACCSVNVPGFMNVRPTARVAGGAVLALVAAGTRELNEIRHAMLASTAVVARLETLEARVDQLAPTEPAAAAEPVIATPEPETLTAEPPVVATTPEPAAVEPPVTAEPIAESPPASDEPDVPELSPEEVARADRIARVRSAILAEKRAALRARVNAPAPTMAAMASTVKGTDSFPISDVASLKRAIMAFGRAGDKAAAKKHIVSMAYKLKRPDLIPSNWKTSK